MAFLLVTVGTDGAQNWVQTPDGHRLNLGPMTILSFVTKLARNATVARHTLRGFLKGGEALLSVDADKMWALMQPRRAIWGSGDDSLYVPSFVMAKSSETKPLDQQHQNHSPMRSNMHTILDDLAQAEQKIAHLNKLAAAGKQDPEAIAELVKLAQKIKSPNQSNNSTYYGLGEPKVHLVTDAAPAPHTVKLAFDVYAGNMGLIDGIVASAKETVATIDTKVAGAKSNPAKINALTRAKAHIHSITSKTGSICEKTQLIEDWVGGDLQKLAAEMTSIHELFHPQA